ncbi:hypothetical protein GCM10023328_01860 [Modestobacter marinus]|uniref:Anti-sigma regulatory factor (Ser/Thr protein kinase) n=1 Tax=Modestobacter marinus TaxID=477641 RepID=A0A846LGU3_9ACTN|nr:ATP-binding protein [Modestobacter marinus]NIH67383.1 anti-sigma regulatory factor (Ser/Thr protein kinase) [Modestobacter marinus]GGL54406.1 hypothetical protein GCM10011589_08100 [Modestobacter marinus]
MSPVSSFTASVDLPPQPSSVPLARRLVREVLATWQAPQDREDAELLVTELVANVVDHAGGDVLSLELSLAGPVLRVGVRDGSAVMPVIRELSLTEERGRGMRLVAAIAERWGCEAQGTGKRVWFELPPAGDRGARAAAGLPPGQGGDGPGDRDRQTKESSHE